MSGTGPGKAMSARKSMFVIWAVASMLWVPFSYYMFRVDLVMRTYHSYDRYAEKVAHGRAAEPYRYDYYRRSYERASRDVQRANKDLGLFFLIGFGLPGILLAVGTMVMEAGERHSARRQ